MKGLEVKINDEAAIDIELNGVISVIVLYHNEQTGITISGLRTTEEENNEKVHWLDRPLTEEDTITIKLNNSIVSETPPRSSKVEITNSDDSCRIGD